MNYILYNYILYNYILYNYILYNYILYNYILYNYILYNYILYNYILYNYILYNYILYNYILYNYILYNYHIGSTIPYSKYISTCLIAGIPVFCFKIYTKALAPISLKLYSILVKWFCIPLIINFHYKLFTIIIYIYRLYFIL